MTEMALALRGEAANISTVMMAVCAGRPLLAACTAFAIALTGSVKEHMSREEFEKFVRGEFADWSLMIYDGKPEAEGGDAS